ncbi:MAG: putative mycofactocin biosynthesis glycosyltransferase MftF [Chloroflexi bacterium]|nr:putative mycofactocin biosynthesis glycosyltransferase MftF [Chloroflexota bacterium]
MTSDIGNCLQVSVLIPCYNQAQHIGGVIQGVLAQTHSPQEIIVVDDASTDQSARVIGGFPVTRLHHEENRGPAAARNTALHAARGEIVLYLDADAFPRPDLIETLLRAYQALDGEIFPSLAGIGGRGIEVHQKNLADRWRGRHARQDFGDEYRAKVPFLFGLCASYRRSVLEDVDGFDESFPRNAGEDFELGCRLRRAGYQLHYEPQAIVDHYHADTVKSLKNNQSNWYYWSYIAKSKNHAHPWTLWMGTFRRLFTDPLGDLFLHGDWQLARLSLQIFGAKIAALFEAASNPRATL